MAVINPVLSLCLLVLLVDAPTTAVSTVTPDAATSVTSTVSPGATTTNVTTVTPDRTIQTDAATSVTSTVSPGATTTNVTTVTPDGTIQTVTSSNASSNATAGSTPALTTPKPGHCASNPCLSGSTCVELSTNFKCVCQAGLVYDEALKTCILAKTFPSDIKLNKVFNEQMADQNSDTFKKTAEEIVDALKVTFNSSDGYLGSVVLSLKQGSVIADVDNFFSITSNVNSEKVLNEIKNSNVSLFSGAEVTVKNICLRNFCDPTSTECNNKDGLASCTCKEGYIKLAVTQQACKSCPSGQKAVQSETCEDCSFGYSGFNCKESYLLILVVVACVLSSLLLCTFISAVVLYSRSTKMIKSSDKKQSLHDGVDFKKPVEIPRIPRANANSGWQPTNLEMTESGSRHALVSKDPAENKSVWDYDDNEDLRGYKSQMPSRTNNGSRATRNPYIDVYENENPIRRY